MPNLVVDIETIPQAFSSLAPEVQRFVRARAEARAQAGTVRPDEDPTARWMGLRPAFGHIVCVCWGTDEPELALTTRTIRRVEEEADLLRSFWEAVAALRRPLRWVTYNGLSFDLPYLLTRSAILGISVPVPVPLRRFAPHEHFDVMEILAHWRPSDRLPLAVVARIFGLSKLDDMDGSDVLAAWRNGETERIAAYCEQDARITYELFRRLLPAWSAAC